MTSAIEPSTEHGDDPARGTVSDPRRSLPETTAWRAVRRRDARYDAEFVYAVKTTGVYCRPSCGSRLPLRSNVRFFPSAMAAETAGFRACLRCRPAAPPQAMPSAVARAVRYLDAHATERVPLRDLARICDISPAHLQRIFTRRIGVSPRAYQDALRARYLRGALRSGDAVSRATYAAGFQSASRLSPRADALLGMTPSQFRRGGDGVEIHFAIARTSLGWVLVAHTRRGVCMVALGNSRADLAAALRREFPRATFAAAANTGWISSVVDHVEGARAAGVPLDVAGTAFQWRVWRALQRIPRGETRTYGQLAAMIGRPAAARAVARACATNAVAVLVPCHRVVRADGEPGGYRWGIERKTLLLERERRRGGNVPSRGRRDD